MRALSKLTAALVGVLVLSGCAQSAGKESAEASPTTIAQACVSEVTIDGADFSLSGNVVQNDTEPIPRVVLSITGSTFDAQVCSDEQGKWRAVVPRESSYTFTIDPATAPEGLVITSPDVDETLSFAAECCGLGDRKVVNIFFSPEGAATTSAALLDADYVNSDGYQYSAQVRSATIEPEVDKANAKPGEVLMQLRSRVDASVTNTTPERVAPAAGKVTPYWLLESPVCAYAPKIEASFCWFPNLSIDLVAPGTGQGEIPVAGTIDVPADWAPTLSSPLIVPEADEPSVSEAASTPDGYLLYGEGLATGAGAQGCLVESFTYVVAASGPRADLGC